MNKILLTLISFFLLTGVVCAEEIVLKSGISIQGKIIERSDKWIKVNASGMDVTYYLDEIQSIDGNPAGIAVPPSSPVAVPSLPKAEAVPSAGTRPSAGTSVPIDEIVKQTITGSSSLDVSQSSSRSVFLAGDRSKPSQKLTPVETLVVLAVMLIVIGIALVLFCYPLFVIAKKTGAQYPYIAFIPLLNYYLMCKISGRPVWWILLFLIPFVNMVIDIIVWTDIAKVRQKPAWLGLLVVVPLLNLFMMWYVALSDEPEAAK